MDIVLTLLGIIVAYLCLRLLRVYRVQSFYEAEFMHFLRQSGVEKAFDKAFEKGSSKQDFLDVNIDPYFTFKTSVRKKKLFSQNKSVLAVKRSLFAQLEFAFPGEMSIELVDMIMAEAEQIMKSVKKGKWYNINPFI